MATDTIALTGTHSRTFTSLFILFWVIVHHVRCRDLLFPFFVLRWFIYFSRVLEILRTEPRHRECFRHEGAIEHVSASFTTQPASARQTEGSSRQRRETWLPSRRNRLASAVVEQLRASSSRCAYPTVCTHYSWISSLYIPSLCIQYVCVCGYIYSCISNVLYISDKAASTGARPDVCVCNRSFALTHNSEFTLSRAYTLLP